MDEQKEPAGTEEERPRWSASEFIHSTTVRAAGILTRAEKLAVRRRLTLSALGLVVFAAILAILGNYLTLPRTPEHAVRNYLGALQGGKYFLAVDRSAYRDESAIFLKNSTYRAATGRVENYSITSTRIDGDTAQVEVLVTAGGKDESLSLSLVKEHRSGLNNDIWKLSYSPQLAQPLTSELALDEIAVNGKTLKLKEENSRLLDNRYSWNLLLLPGNFVFDLPDNSYYELVGGEKTVSVGLNQAGELSPLSLDIRPSARMWSETNSSIESWLKKCESSKSLAPATCPASEVFDASGRRLKTGSGTSASGSAKVDISDVQWNLLSRPTLVLEQARGSAQTWVASTYKPAVFELTYEADGEKQTETVEFYIDARAVSNGATATISSGLASGKKE